MEKSFLNFKVPLLRCYSLSPASCFFLTDDHDFYLFIYFFRQHIPTGHPPTRRARCTSAAWPISARRIQWV